MDCPLKNTEQQFKNARQLIRDCVKTKCWYVRSELQDEYLPSGCLLLVACLFASKREKAKQEPVFATRKPGVPTRPEMHKILKARSLEIQAGQEKSNMK